MPKAITATEIIEAEKAYWEQTQKKLDLIDKKLQTAMIGAIQRVLDRINTDEKTKNAL